MWHRIGSSSLSSSKYSLSTLKSSTSIRMCVIELVLTLPYRHLGIVGIASSFLNTHLEVCLRSLSCIRQWCRGYFKCKKGISEDSKMLVYPLAFIFPSKITTCAAPRQLMPPHACTLTGCFGLQQKDNHDMTANTLEALLEF